MTILPMWHRSTNKESNSRKNAHKKPQQNGYIPNEFANFVVRKCYPMTGIGVTNILGLKKMKFGDWFEAEKTLG